MRALFLSVLRFPRIPWLLKGAHFLSCPAQLLSSFSAPSWRPPAWASPSRIPFCFPLPLKVTFQRINLLAELLIYFAHVAEFLLLYVQMLLGLLLASWAACTALVSLLTSSCRDCTSSVRFLTLAALIWLVFFFLILSYQQKNYRKLYPCCWSNQGEQRGGIRLQINEKLETITDRAASEQGLCPTFLKSVSCHLWSSRFFF